jgi:flavin-binding protein dodecin
MSVAKVSELVSRLTRTAADSLDDAMKKGIAGGNRTIRDVRVWWIKEERVSTGSRSGYQVNMMIGFVIDE